MLHSGRRRDASHGVSLVEYCWRRLAGQCWWSCVVGHENRSSCSLVCMHITQWINMWCKSWSVIAGSLMKKLAQERWWSSVVSRESWSSCNLVDLCITKLTNMCANCGVSLQDRYWRRLVWQHWWNCVVSLENQSCSGIITNVTTKCINAWFKWCWIIKMLLEDDWEWECAPPRGPWNSNVKWVKKEAGKRKYEVFLLKYQTEKRWLLRDSYGWHFWRNLKDKKQQLDGTMSLSLSSSCNSFSFF